MSIRSAVLAAAFVAAASFLAPSAAVATTGGCAIPSLSVSLYLDDFFDFSFSSNVQNCLKQCAEIRTACRAVAQASDRCVKGAVDGFLDVDKVGCKDLEQPSENECKQSNSDSAKGFQEGLKSDLSNALDTCNAAADSCEASCELD